VRSNEAIVSSKYENLCLVKNYQLVFKAVEKDEKIVNFVVEFYDKIL
jgi:hypothetical protein